MNGRFKPLLSSILLAISLSTFADATNNNDGGAQDSTNLSTYLQNLGEYLGYDITQYCTTGGSCSANKSASYSNLLINANAAYTNQLNLFNSYLGALLGASNVAGNNIAGTGANTMPFVTGAPPYAIINQLGGQTFTTPAYASPSPTNISVSPLIDQQPYQSDPVSQAVLDILATPNYTFCMDNSGQTFTQNCPTLFREKIMADIVGDIQGTQAVFTPAYNQTFVNQLNIDTLISPLLYSTVQANSNTSSSGSSGNPNNQQNTGLPADSQAQQAANFIRYASGAVTPLSLPTLSNYDSLVNQAQNLSKNVTPAVQFQAQRQLTNYITRLRTYAAQSSVGISNLYYMLSRRMPQNLPGSNNPSSAALNEFIMASWRLYNPSVGANGEQWLTQINQASSASLQKEIAILLAEINYQLYLSRQQQERLLLTNTMQLIQNSQVSQPDNSLSSTEASSTATSSSNASTGG